MERTEFFDTIKNLSPLELKTLMFFMLNVNEFSEKKGKENENISQEKKE